MNSIAGKFLSVCVAGLTLSAHAAPKNIVISLDGATPRLVEQYMANGVLPADQGIGLLRRKGFSALLNETISPSLTAPGHIAIATGSRAAKNDIIANTFHLVASPFNANISGFGAPIGVTAQYCERESAGNASSIHVDDLRKVKFQRLPISHVAQIHGDFIPRGDCAHDIANVSDPKSPPLRPSHVVVMTD